MPDAPDDDGTNGDGNGNENGNEDEDETDADDSGYDNDDDEVVLRICLGFRDSRPDVLLLQRDDLGQSHAMQLCASVPLRLCASAPPSLQSSMCLRQCSYTPAHLQVGTLIHIYILYLHLHASKYSLFIYASMHIYIYTLILHRDIHIHTCLFM